MAKARSNRKSSAEAPQAPARKSRGKRYGQQEKQAILEKAVAELKSGGQITKVAEKLGVTFFTLKAWLKEKGVSEFSERSKTKRGRGVAKKTKKAAPEVRAEKPAATPAPKKMAVASVASKDKPDYVKELERKIEELMQKTRKLSHLYGELRSEVGIED